MELPQDKEENCATSKNIIPESNEEDIYDMSETAVAQIIKERVCEVFLKSYDPASMDQKSLDQIRNNEILQFNIFLWTPKSTKYTECINYSYLITF